MAAPSSGPRVGVRRALTALVVAACLLTSTLSRAEADGGDATDNPGPGVLHGVVTGSDGAARAEVSVRVYGWDATADSYQEIASELTGDDGVFSISGLSTGRYTVEYVDVSYPARYIVTWWGSHWRLEDAEAIEITAERPSVDASIQLLLGGTISGRITTLDGTGLARAHVSLQGMDPGYPPVDYFADEDGNYKIDRLYPGTYRLNLAGPWRSSWIDTWWQDADNEGAATELVIEPGTVLQNIDAALAAPSSISGRLVDIEGNPVANISVSPFTRRNHGKGEWIPANASSKTNASGEFTAYGLRVGEYRLAFYPGSLNTVYPNQWLGATTVESEATSITVPVEARVKLGDITILRSMDVASYGSLSGAPTVGVAISSGTAPYGVKGLQGTYQWRSDGVTIAGATGDRYVVQPEDLGTRLTVRAWLSAPGYAPTTVSRFASELVGPGRFTPHGEAFIGGAGRVGATLDASSAGLNWEPHPDTVGYQWQRDGRNIVGQTGSTYVTTTSDYGRLIRAVVRVTKPGYEPAETYASADSTCYPASDIPPLSVRGERVVGSTLTVTTVPPATYPGVWYEWRADGYILWNEEKATLKLTKALAGKRIRPIVRRQVGACDALVQEGPDNAPLTALAGTPKIHGPAKVHATLKVKPGTWSRGTTFHYRWYADGQAIARATKSTLRIATSLKGKVITVAVTGKNPGFETVTRTSAATRRVR